MTEVESRPGRAGHVVDRTDIGPDLVEAIRAGDEYTFAGIVRFWSPLLLRTATALTGDQDAAHAVVRETWLRVLGGVATFQPPPRLRAWVCALMLGTIEGPDPALEEADDRPVVAPARFLPPGHDQWPGHWAVPPAPWPAMEDARPGPRGVGGVLRSALAGLPQQQRVVVSLRDVAGCEVAEISQIVQTPPEQVRLLLHRGRSALRSHLEVHFGQPATS